jgi:EAL domain-containing protein (putative c-di-GMP-specific phosphodiesterase class I)
LTALDRDEFFCVYQPQYDSHTLQLTGIETLVRWNNPVHGQMAPSEFLPLAEELQIIDQIDKIVLRLALRDLVLWQGMGLNVPRLSINISGRRLQDPGLAQELIDLSMPEGVVSFEFLESIFLDEPDEIQMANINCIRQLGIGIEVDDFGSGHSSIVSLLKLKPDRLKIDRFIVEPVTRSDRQRHLVQSIVDIGKLQGIKVLAEGVETVAHVKILQAIGCDELQGFALSRPIPAAQLVALLAPKAPVH